MAWHGMVGMMLLAGCGPSPGAGDADVAAILARGRADVPADDAAVHDAGPILASGQEIRHAFTLKNHADRPLRLLRAQALTPCCSVVEDVPGPVPPGGSVEVPVLFRPGFQSGRKQVEFVVQTDDEARPVRRFALVATLISEVEVASSDGPDAVLPLGQTGRQRFTITCRRIEAPGADGTTTEGRPAPDSLVASAPLTARFVDEPAEHRDEDGTITTTRTVEVALPASAEEGSRRGEVVLRWPDGRDWSQIVTWQVTPRIRATPPGLVLRADAAGPAPTWTVALRAEDRAFRVTRITGPILAEPITNLPTEPSRTHTLTLRLDPSATEDGTASDIQISTDHPDQPGVSLSVFVLPPTTRGEE